jgi:ABC-type multidrug transport system fused ATPase/permease subunit
VYWKAFFGSPSRSYAFWLYDLPEPATHPLFVILLPVAGFILGRVGRTLKKQNQEVLQRYGDMFSTIEETLGGIRVIKAFNAEKRVQLKFNNQNDQFII